MRLKKERSGVMNAGGFVSGEVGDEEGMGVRGEAGQELESCETAMSKAGCGEL